jgi:predicted GNAT family acetyltransferase
MTVTDNRERNRYELREDDQLVGYSEYHFYGDEVAFLHTEIDERFSGRGLGGEVVRAALDDVRSRGLRVLPYCPFVREWIGRHPEYLDLVPETHRAMFDL